MIKQSYQEKLQDVPADLVTISRMRYKDVPTINDITAMPITARSKVLTNDPSGPKSMSSYDDGVWFDGGGRNIELPIFSSLRINIVLYNLMDSLPGKIKLIRDLAERQSGSTHFENFRISSNICGRPWLKRAPLPSRNFLDSFYSIFRKFFFSISLPRITDPGTKINFFALYKFYVNRGNSAMSFSNRELPKSIYVHLKTCCVVHSLDSNTDFSNNRKQLLFKKSPSST